MVRIILACCLFMVIAGLAPPAHITVYMIGDSTMADKPLDDNPERGWGQLFPRLFDSTVTVENHAMNGRSTRSFLAENRWQPILDKLRPGDYVIIQFGHNDEKPEKTDRYTPPADYRKNLIRFASETLAKKAHPILCTPIVRRRFDKDGKFYDEHGVYPGIVREVARQLDVPLLDMHRRTQDLLVALGPEKSKELFLWIGPGVYKSLPDGRQDNTHFGDYGAKTMAAIAADLLREQASPLAGHLRHGGTVEVRNPAPFDRPRETVELPWPEIGFSSPSADVGIFESGRQLVSQKIDEDADGVPDKLVFQSGFAAGETKKFDVREAGESAESIAVTDAKYTLPRKDVAWENDRIAFRIYGGPLAGDVLNGLDVWTKRVRYHIIDKWYGGDSLKGKARISYHVDHGEGADLFQVGRSLGAGSSARWREGKLDQAGMFSSYRIIATGPIRAMFSVTYRRDSAAVMEERTYTLDAGMNLNRIDVGYPAGPDSGLETAVGLVKRRGTFPSADTAAGWLALWGPTDEDSTNGFLGTGAVIAPESRCRVFEDSTHQFIAGTAQGGLHFRYYAGAGWTRSGDFRSASDWQEYLSAFARSLRYPLQIEFR